MKKFFKENGSVNLAVLIIIAIIVICLAVFMIKTVKPTSQPGNSNTQRSLNDNPEEPEEEPEEEPIEDIDYNSEDFSYEFLKMESKENEGTNIIYSPLSIKYALNLLNEGANGKTKEEIDNIIGDLKLTKYKNIDKVMSLANSVWIRERYKDGVLDSYNKAVEDKYNAEIKYDKFESAKNINRWISDKTFGIINDFFTDERIKDDEELFMILVNALAIDMEWDSNFSTNNTANGIFDKDGSNLNVAFMKKSNVFEDGISYKIDDDVTVLAMDLKEYDGVQLEFDAIMPNEEALDEFITNIDSQKIDKYLSNLTKASETEDDVNVKVPKFDFDYSIMLKQELMAMGMKLAFGHSADFSKITGDDSLYVNDAIHKADIEFSEHGIRAAAVTTFMLDSKAMMAENDVINVNIDKPFLFVIRDKETGEVWFVGSVYNPVLWDDVKAEYNK